MQVPAANPDRREGPCDANVSLRCPEPCPSEFLSKVRVLLSPLCACPAMRDCTHPQRGDAASAALAPAPGACWWLSHRTSFTRHAKLQSRAVGIRGAPRVAAVPRIPTLPQLRHGLLAQSNCNPGPPGTCVAKGEGRQDQHPAGTHSGGGGYCGRAPLGSWVLPQGNTGREGMRGGGRGWGVTARDLEVRGTRRSPLGDSRMEIIHGCSWSPLGTPELRVSPLGNSGVILGIFTEDTTGD